MQIPPQSKRKCEECLNTIPLNHFRLNSSKCRYCQDGLIVPTMLIEVNNDIEAMVQVNPINKTNQEEFSKEGNSIIDETNDDTLQSQSSEE